MDTNQYLDLITKYLSGNLSEDEKYILTRWAEADAQNRQFLDEMISLWKVTDPPATVVTPPQRKAEIWAQIEERIDAHPDNGLPPQANRIRWFQWGPWIAAATILALIAWTLWKWNDQERATKEVIEIQASNSAPKKWSLPDGSEVVLNQHSTLTYPAAFDDRVVSLSGEAYFSVTENPDEPFLVKAGGTETRVLGTTFFVRAYPAENAVEVTVTTGKVAFSAAGASDTLFLTPNQTGSFDKGQEQLLEIEITTLAPNYWMEGKLQAEGATIRELLEAAERFFGVSIVIDDQAVLDCAVNGVYEPDEWEILAAALEYTYGLEVKEQNGAYFIRGACQ